MKYKYSSTTDAFYPTGMLDAYINLPSDLVEVSEQVYETVLRARTQALQYRIADDGTSVSVAPSAAHDWDVKTEKWVLNDSTQVALTKASIQHAKSIKSAEINARAQDFINLATGASETPSFEVQTWAQQAAEAKAWHADSSVPTPMLTIIANQRGLPVDILRQKAHEKAVAYEQLVAVIAGKRQKYEQMLDAAKTVDEIEKIVVEYVI